MADIPVSCRLCGGSVAQLLDLGKTALANEIWDRGAIQDVYPLRVGQCRRCDHVQLMDRVAPERLFPPNYPYRSGTTETFRAYLREFAGSIHKRFYGSISENSPVVDIGSNDGSLLQCFAEIGYDSLLGIDPAVKAGQLAHCNGIATIASSLNHDSAHRAKQLIGHPRLVTALNVMAHLDDYELFADEIRYLLSDQGSENGIFVFEVGYLPRILQRGDLGVIYHEHTSYHHLLPLIPFFLGHGLSLFDAELTSSQGGSVRGYVRKGHRPMTPRLRELLQHELHLDVQQKLFEAAKKAQRFGEKVRSYSKPVVGYGAPAKLTTQLQAMGFTPETARHHFSMIVDDNPNKIGRYTPGTHIPIRAPSHLGLSGAEASVIFSYNFADEIKAKHPEFKGEWLVPV